MRFYSCISGVFGFFFVFSSQGNTADIVILEQEESSSYTIVNEDENPTLFFGDNLVHFLEFDEDDQVFRFSEQVSLGGNEIQNFRLENADPAPDCSAESIGKAYYNTQSTYSYICNGEEWKQIDKPDNETPPLLPYLYTLSPQKIQIGNPVKITITGENFLPTTQFRFTPDIPVEHINIVNGEKAEIFLSNETLLFSEVSISALSQNNTWEGNTLSIFFYEHLDTEDILDQFQESASEISTWVPHLYPIRFDDTLRGNKIIDGGNDMYDTGNILNTNLTSAISYTDGEIIQDESIWGEGGEYFTDVSQNIFFLSARVGEGVDAFSITGNLGADNRGHIEVGTIEYGDYTAYFKKVYGAGSDPSVNHMIIVNTSSPLNHVFPDSTDNDFDSISGLSALVENDNPRLFYLLFASRNGGYIDNTQMENILIYTVDTILQ